MYVTKKGTTTRRKGGGLSIKGENTGVWKKEEKGKKREFGGES